MINKHNKTVITINNNDDVTFISDSSFQYISELFINCLKTIGNFVVESHENKYSTECPSSEFSGRDGSTYFENKIAKKIINKNFQNIVSEVKIKNNIDLLNIHAPVAENESEIRGKYDLSLTLELKDNKGNLHPVTQYVNIKYTKGGTNDNTGGKEIISRSILNIESAESNVINLLNQCSDSILNNQKNAPYSDYFFLIFKKADSNPTDECAVKTILTNDWEGPNNSCIFNSSQTFPHIQMKYSSNPVYNFHTGLNGSRENLLQWLVSKMVNNKSKEFALLILLGSNMSMQYKN